MKESSAEVEEIDTKMVLEIVIEKSKNVTAKLNIIRILSIIMRKNQEIVLMPSENSTEKSMIAKDRKKITVERVEKISEPRSTQLRIKSPTTTDKQID